jgi:uncharacterized protein (TIGR03435 family)
MCGVVCLLAAGALLAQDRPAFEAVSIKLNANGIGSSSNGSPGQVIMTNQTLKRLIERAYGLKPFQVIGPSWLESVHFDIAAKYPPNTKNADRPVMLRTLLEDRFKLATHRESRDLPGYALQVVKGGFKLKPVEGGQGDSESHGDGKTINFKAQQLPMADLADYLGRRLGEAVVDGTGISGSYTYELHWTTGESAPGDDPVTIQVAALQEALGTIGLRLHAQKVPVEVVVIDHLEKAPVEN